MHSPNLTQWTPSEALQRQGLSPMTTLFGLPEATIHADVPRTLSQMALFPYIPRTLDEIVFASSNIFGIPDLDLSMQADDLTPPALTWGALPVRKQFPGTYFCYTIDSDLQAVWNAPDKALVRHPDAIVEPNFSTQYRMPPSVAIYNTFRKRWLARYWQSQGVKTIVDLNVAPQYRLLNLVGVPQGWTIYSTRSCHGFLDWLDADYALAKAHAGTDPTFFVYGGKPGREVWRICQRRGWVHIADWTSTIGKPTRHQQITDFRGGDIRYA